MKSSINDNALKLGSLVKASAWGVAGLYCLGFLSLNSYLMRFGIAEFDFLQTRFIYTGTLAFLSIVGSSVLPIYWGNYIKNILKNRVRISSDLRARYKFLVCFLVLVFRILALVTMLSPILFHVVFVTLFYGFKDSGVFLITRSTILSCMGFLTSMVIWLIISVIEGRKNTFLEKYDKDSPAWLRLGILSSAFVFTLGGYLAVFGDFVMPRVPSFLGGNQPQNIQILVDDENVNGLIEIGIPFDEGKLLSNSISLIYEGGDYLVLTNSNLEITKIDSKVILGIVINSE